LNRRIFDLVKSEEPHEKLGGIFAMDALVDVECEESPTFITRFANYLRLILPCNNVSTMIMASKVLGHLAQAGGTLTADFVEFEMKRALEGLNAEKRSEHHRLAAVLVCKELAINAPTLFFMHVPAYVKAIWAGILDVKQLIREAAIESLRACLGIIAQRDIGVRNKLFSVVFEEAERGCRQMQVVEVVHGSLLVFGELLQLPEVMESQMPAGFNLENINNTVMLYCNHRVPLLRKTVIHLLPIVARMDSETFRANFAADAVAHLIITLKKSSTEREVTFLSLSALLHVAGPRIVEPYRDDIIALVLDGITPTQRKPLVIEAATCIASLAALDPSCAVVQERMPDLIEQMLAASEGNLTPSLIAALSDIALSMPLLLPDIQIKLLDSISFTLQRTPYQVSK
jgi:FKBP12-rapamycin complex-associated protein